MVRPTRAQIAARKADIPHEAEEGGALMQGIKILRRLQHSSAPLTAPMIAGFLGCSLGRAEGLLSTLSDFHLLQEKEGAEYEADMGLLQLCLAATANVEIVQLFGRAVAKCLDGRDFNANLYVADRSSALCLADVGGGVMQEVGGIEPLGYSEVGHTLIWAGDIKQRHRLLEVLCEEGESAGSLLEMAYLSFHRLEQRGYCWSQLDADGSFSCFAPIWPTNDRPGYVVGLTGEASISGDEQELGDLVLQVASEFSDG